MHTHWFIIATAAFLLQAKQISADASGYHYDPPSSARRPQQNSGHYFAPLSTVAPLPAVPALPALPTARSKTQVQTQSLLQVHPPPRNIGSAYQYQPPTPSRSIASAYQPPSVSSRSIFPPSAPQFQAQAQFQAQPQFQAQAPQYQTQAPQYQAQLPQFQAQPPAKQYPAPAQRPQYGLRNPPTIVPGFQLLVPTAPAPLLGQRYNPQTPPSGQAFVPASPAQAGAQPLRIPYGKQPVFNYPSAGADDSQFYQVNGRQVKQYAVIEFIDNDIEQPSRPFLTQSHINSYRSTVGASGTGAIPPLPPTGGTSGLQIDSRSDTLITELQRFGQQNPTAAAGTASGAIALGSGGLGFIRLPNGEISLGSGSLNYASGQQISDSVREARTRFERVQDPLHFGHGPLGGVSNFPFK